MRIEPALSGGMSVHEGLASECFDLQTRSTYPLPRMLRRQTGSRKRVHIGCGLGTDHKMRFGGLEAATRSGRVGKSDKPSTHDALPLPARTPLRSSTGINFQKIWYTGGHAAPAELQDGRHRDAFNLNSEIIRVGTGPELLFRNLPGTNGSLKRPVKTGCRLLLTSRPP